MIYTYQNVEALNQSKLKLLLEDPSLFLKEDTEEPEKAAFILGNALDGYARDNKNYFYDNYFISNYQDKISDNFVNLIKTLVNKVEDFNINSLVNGEYDSYILETYSELNYQNKWTPKTKIDNVLKEINYIEELINNKGKTLLDSDMFEYITNVTESLFNCEHLKGIFNNPDRVFQKEIYWDMKDTGKINYSLPCKGAIDIFIKDDENKTIMFYDLKTTSYGYLDFYKAAKKFRYDIQMAFYKTGLEVLYPDYTVLNPQFITVPKNKLIPAIFQTTNTFIERGLKGDEEYKGILGLLEDLKFYQDNNNFETPRLLQESNFVLNIY